MLSGLLASMQNRAKILVNFQEQRSIQGIEFGKRVLFFGLKDIQTAAEGSNVVFKWI